MSAPPQPPASTYRLQLQPGFTFADAAAAVPRLADLGVTHLHLSPVLEAVPGSTHGYDVVDHTRVRAELGGEQGLRELSRTARGHGLGLVLDIVPNHMAVPAPEHLNGPLWEVLRDGPAAAYAHWFDIEWQAQGGRVLLPVLGEPEPDALGDLSVGHDKAAGGRVLRYHDHRFPLRPGTEELPLPELLARQHYRLAYWREARTGLNYRRFFTISDLIAVRVEHPEVFAATHATVLRLLDEGVVHGLRVDHPDGLADPAGYLRRLAAATGGRWTVVEKILGRDEALPADWACAGTTGYDALDRVDGLFTDPAGAARLADGYRSFTAVPDDLGGRWEPTVARAAREVACHDLATEVDRLARAAGRAGCGGPAPYPPQALRTAIRELLVRVPVYRPYVRPGAPAGATDAAMLERAAAGARQVCPGEAGAALTDVLALALGGEAQGGAVREAADADAARPDAADADGACPDVADAAAAAPDGADPDDAGPGGGGRDAVRQAAADFCVRFAQTASALHAKAVEDRAFYRYVPLLSACEVGRDPGHPAATPAGFHAWCARTLRERPATGTVLSTHDTKRSADVRMRLAALSECPEVWEAWLTEVTAGAGGALDRHTVYTALQTAVGLGTCAPERLVPAVLKSVREAGLRTSWTEADEAYEKAVAAFVEREVCGTRAGQVAALVTRIEPYARANALGAALLHLTMPGVPDLYQGTEGAVYALVDPDNRAPLGQDGQGPRDHDGLGERKRALTAAVLRLRRDNPRWYGPGASYEPLAARGPAAGHCVAFVRGGGAVTVVTRLSRRLEQKGGWRGSVVRLPPGGWRDAVAAGPVREGAVPLAELVTSDAPAVLLTRLP